MRTSRQFQPASALYLRWFPVRCRTAWLIDQAFPAADTSDFAGSVRCDVIGEGLFSAVALEMDPGTRIFATLPVVPVLEMPDRE